MGLIGWAPICSAPKLPPPIASIRLIIIRLVVAVFRHFPLGVCRAPISTPVEPRLQGLLACGRSFYEKVREPCPPYRCSRPQQVSHRSHVTSIIVEHMLSKRLAPHVTEAPSNSTLMLGASVFLIMHKGDWISWLAVSSPHLRKTDSRV